MQSGRRETHLLPVSCVLCLLVSFLMQTLTEQTQRPASKGAETLFEMFFSSSFSAKARGHVKREDKHKNSDQCCDHNPCSLVFEPDNPWYLTNYCVVLIKFSPRLSTLHNFPGNSRILKRVDSSPPPPKKVEYDFAFLGGIAS